MSETRLDSLDFSQLTSSAVYYKSPTAWEDQVLYFLMLDRFSDGNEKGYKDAAGKAVSGGTTPLFKAADNRNAIQTEADATQWQEAGGKYVGGTLQGLKSKLGYLKRLGITAIWISPVFKQVAFQETYHGYGIQDFLQVNPRFGSNQELKELVEVAHQQGIRVILDIILNHAGDVFSYSDSDPYWEGRVRDAAGFNDKNGQPDIPFLRTDPVNPATWPDKDGAVWPLEFQNPDYFTRKGYIKNYDYDPEFKEGDFCDLKDLHHGYGTADEYQTSPALLRVGRDSCKKLKKWIYHSELKEELRLSRFLFGEFWDAEKSCSICS